MIESLRIRSLLGAPALLLALLQACGAAPAPEPQAPAVDADAKLKLATQANSALNAQLAQAPHDILVHCQTTAGDCLISVAERREALVGKYYLNACRDPDPDKQSPCIVHELEQRGERSDLASYYETENWCSHKLLECMTAFTNSAEQMAIRERTQERRTEIEAAPESIAAERAPEFAKEKLDFVRSILPPKAQAECPASPPSTSAECTKTLAAPSAEFEAELAHAPASYDPKRALILYAAIPRAEAGCSTPELNCLLDQIAQSGASPEADKLLKQNLTLLAQQQQIRATADPGAADQCVSTGVTQHSSRIVSAYQAYAAAPAAALMVRLQKAFIAMHQMQLWCLMALGKPGKR
ncbi:MAG: hypothetical protein WDO69_05695 [Pseudomonadota bacterium]